MIADAFRRLIESLALAPADHDAYARHRREIANCLHSAFDIAEILPFGSNDRGCAIRGASDLDLLVVLRRGEVRRGTEVKSSTRTLSLVRGALAKRFPRTSLGRDGQAIVVTFSDTRAVDVVPAWWAEARSDGWPTYCIPDGAGEWMPTSPKRHAKLISEADARSGGKLKHVARLLKHWRVCRSPSVAVSSFYAELLMAETDLCRVGTSYGECFAALLEALLEHECEPISDPLGVSEEIHACGSLAKQRSAIQVIARSLQRAARALDCEQRGSLSEARRLWALVFNGAF